MAIGDFITPDPIYTPLPPRGKHGAHLKCRSFISGRIKARGHIEWTGETLEEAQYLWRDGKTKAEIAEHFNVTFDSIVGMIFRNRAFFEKRR